MNRSFLGGLIGAAVLLFVFIVGTSSMTYMVEPGTRGIRVPSRNRSQLSRDSWMATIVQPSADGPAA